MIEPTHPKPPVFAATASTVCFFVMAALLLHTAWTINHAPMAHEAWQLVGAGICYLLLLALGRPLTNRKYTLLAIGLAGLALRLVLIGIPPANSGDYDRYFWDGAVLAHCISPYTHSPASVRSASAVSPSMPSTLLKLKEQSGRVLGNINHPKLRTIYPPITESFFALAYMLSPWNTTVWRVELLCFDLATGVLLVHLLKKLDRPMAWAAIYWFNPIVLSQSYIHMHFDVMIGPFIVLFVLLAMRPHRRLASLVLALATAMKLWPVALAPLLWRRIGRRPLAIFLTALLFVGMTGLLLLPMFQPSHGAGLKSTWQYARYWQNNSGLFFLQRWAWQHLLGPKGEPIQVAGLLARGSTALLMIGVLALALKRCACSRESFIAACLLVVAAIFMLSPAQFPWYYIWMVPLLALRPRASLLAYSSTLGLYYLFDRVPWIWLEHGIIWIWLAAELFAVWYWRPAKPVIPLPSSTTAPSQLFAQVNIIAIIPALNEEIAIRRVLQRLPQWLTPIVVDNGSTDRTAEIARSCGAMVIHEPNRGYGAACLAGIKAASSADILVFMDADDADDPADIPALVAPIIFRQADMVIGSRLLGGAQPGSLTLPQRFGNRLACFLMRLFWGARFSDLGPLRAIAADKLALLNMSDRRFGWTVQMQIRALRRGLRCGEISVAYRRRVGVSKISGTLRGVLGAGAGILTMVAREALCPDKPIRTTERLIIFARLPVPGFTKTRLIAAIGAEAAAKLQTQMTHHILDVARKFTADTGAEVEVRFTGGEAHQMGAIFGRDFPLINQGEGDLGRRMGQAAQDAFAQGIQRTVIIGTDCPQLTPAILHRAMNALKSHDIVIGPAFDGGYYLIGLSRFIPSLFQDILWGTKDVFQQTLLRANTIALRVGLLKPLSDVDHPEDIAVWHSMHTPPTNNKPAISVIIPMLNEAANIRAAIASARRSPSIEVIVVDAGSTDESVRLAREDGARVITSQRGRANQMNAGAWQAQSDILLFLHADTRLPPNYLDIVLQTAQKPNFAAGAFRLGIDAEGLPLRIIEWGANLRSQLLRCPYGDQAMFMKADSFYLVGGFPQLPVLEDLALIQSLGGQGRILLTRAAVMTSARSWRARGALAVTLLHQIILLGYVCGLPLSLLTKLKNATRRLS
ncbi:MAG: TIGR04283 family arsenosugar biosynthesis glycosyltransferase [Phycisphaerae bacterium]